MGRSSSHGAGRGCPCGLLAPFLALALQPLLGEVDSVRFPARRVQRCRLVARCGALPKVNSALGWQREFEKTPRGTVLVML
jgi:hypothetical protein